MTKSKYLDVLRKFNIIPNFICSQEYFDRSGVEEFEEGEYAYWAENNWIVAPPINISTGELLLHFKGWNYQIWTDFQGWEMSSEYEKKFNDFEYIYDPRHFLNITGSNWAVFRKNIRKFPGRYGNAPLRYMEVPPLYVFEKQLNDLFLEWVKNKAEDQEIYDDGTLMNYLFNGYNRKILVDKNDYVLGINIWDTNYKFINFRFNFTRNIKFLNEYLRHLFFTDPLILNQNKLVNDGGSLNSKSLEAFKDKLNPIEKREIFNYIKMEEK